MFARLKPAADRPAHETAPRIPQVTPAFPPAPQVAPPAPSAPQPAPLLTALQPQIKPSVISNAVSFVGEMTSSGPIHIDGNAKGMVDAESVTVGTEGSFDGRVNCRKLHIKGTFSGSAVCDEVVISEEASVNAMLTYKTLLVHRGAQVNGEFFVSEES